MEADMIASVLHPPPGSIRADVRINAIQLQAGTSRLDIITRDPMATAQALRTSLDIVIRDLTLRAAGKPAETPEAPTAQYMGNCNDVDPDAPDDVDQTAGLPPDTESQLPIPPKRRKAKA